MGLVAKTENGEEILQLLEQRNLQKKIVYRKRIPLGAATAERKPKTADKTHILQYGSKAPKRFKFNTLVKIARADRKLVGRCENISESGIFVHTQQDDFHVGEYVNLVIQSKNRKKNIPMLAQIVRRNLNPKFPLGYGIKFISQG
jgi:hypothetical protein